MVHTRTKLSIAVAFWMVSSFTTIAASALTASSAGATTLPNACTILRAVHPQTIVTTPNVHVGAFVPNHPSGYSGCTVKVGTLNVTLYLSIGGSGGSGGVNIKHETHPAGLGTGDVLLVGTTFGGSPFDSIGFNRVGVYATLGASGASPSRLVALARQVYPRL